MGKPLSNLSSTAGGVAASSLARILPTGKEQRNVNARQAASSSLFPAAADEMYMNYYRVRQLRSATATPRLPIVDKWRNGPNVMREMGRTMLLCAPVRPVCGAAAAAGATTCMPAGGARARPRDPRRRRRGVVCQSRIGAQSENIAVFFPASPPPSLFLFSLLHPPLLPALSVAFGRRNNFRLSHEGGEVHFSASDAAKLEEIGGRGPRRTDARLR